jgi:putative acetyltransferase
MHIFLGRNGAQWGAISTSKGRKMTITVTSENPHDAICIDLVRELSAELGAIYGDDGTGLFTPDDVTIPRSAFVVAWLNDDPVGCGALRPMPDDTIAEVKRMYVRQSARGKGISHQILAKLEEVATEFEYATIQLETGTLQTQAMNLYGSSGYAQIDCYEPYVDSSHSVCYEKRLS